MWIEFAVGRRRLFRVIESGVFEENFCADEISLLLLQLLLLSHRLLEESGQRQVDVGLGLVQLPLG
jgi:hypothetical protein